MTNIRPLMKRVGAYLIDLFLVLIVSSIISSIPLLNKDKEAYQQTYEEYKEKYNEYLEYVTLLEESYEDEEINEEEYTKLTEIELYNEIIISKYEDSEISKEEYKDIVSEINKEFDSLAKDYVYILSKQGIVSSIITLICTIIYFGVLQYFLKGQTIGKKILKLKVVSASDKKINILNYLLRSLIVNDVLLNTIGIIFLLLASKSIYTHANNIIGILVSIVEAVIIFLVLTREDQRGLHDLLFNTKVISTVIVEEPIKKISEEVKLPKENKTKSNSTSKTKSTSNAKKKVIEAEIKEHKASTNASKKTTRTKTNK